MTGIIEKKMKPCQKGRYPDRDSKRALPDKSRELPQLYVKRASSSCIVFRTVCGPQPPRCWSFEATECVQLEGVSPTNNPQN
jgi:hypothetical protein